MTLQTELHITLRKSIASDLEIFFINQADEEANQMAAFTAENPSDREAYFAKWTKILEKPGINMQTVLLADGAIAGSVLTYEMNGETQVSYWIGKQYWGKGIATAALSLFLKELEKRPLYGRAIIDNIASKRVLEKCGFELFAYEKGYANARKAEVDEINCNGA